MAKKGKPKARRKFEPCSDTLECLTDDIAELFGDLSKALWPSDIRRVRSWLKDERQNYCWSGAKATPDVADAFAVIAGRLLGHDAAIRSYQRKQFQLPL